jgi:hypothetical protein
MTTGKSLTIREPGGYLEQKRRRSGFTPSQNQNFHFCFLSRTPSEIVGAQNGHM